MKSRIMDRICAAIFFLFGLFLMISIPQYTNAAKYDPIGSRFFPYAIAVCILAVSGILALTTFTAERYQESDRKEGKFQINVRDNLRTILFCVVLMAAIILIERIHFLVGAGVMLTAMLLLCNVKRVSRYVIIYSCTVFIYIVFTRYFNVRL